MEARDGGTYIDRSTDLTHWQAATKLHLHDQLQLRGYRTKLAPSVWARVSKADLIDLIFKNPPPPEKP
jgi:beta-xylosidase